jgi:hypothetical protein
MADDSYEAIVSVRNAELSAHWTRYNIHTVLNSTILFGFLAAYERSFTGAAIAPAIILGSVLSAVWALMTWRGGLWVRFWNERLAAIEPTSGRPDVFTEAINMSADHGMLRATLVSAAVPLLFSLSWLFFAYMTTGTIWTLRFFICAAMLVAALVVVWRASTRVALSRVRTAELVRT